MTSATGPGRPMVGTAVKLGGSEKTESHRDAAGDEPLLPGAMRACVRLDSHRRIHALRHVALTHLVAAVVFYSVILVDSYRPSYAVCKTCIQLGSSLACKLSITIIPAMYCTSIIHMLELCFLSTGFA